MNLKTAWQLSRETVTDFGEDKAARLGATLAYYSIFSLAPLVTIAIAVAGVIFGREAVTGYLFGSLRGLLGTSGAKLVQDVVANAYRPGHGRVATMFGVVTLLLGASGVFNQLKQSLNAIWGVQEKPAQSLGQTLYRIFIINFLSITMVLGTGFLLAVSLLLNAGVHALSGYLASVLPGGALFWSVADVGVTFAVLTLLFAFMFKYLPDAKIAWRDVWVGSLVTAVLFSVGKVAIGIYIGRSTFISVYGAAASLIVMLLWVYYSAQILFFGAEFTKVYANRCGSHVKPAADAYVVTREAAMATQKPVKPQSGGSELGDIRHQVEQLQASQVRIRSNLARLQQKTAALRQALSRRAGPPRR
jgi:membrane protein